MSKESFSFVNHTIQEAYRLLQLTHEYVKWQAPLDIENMDQEQTVKISCEAMRITVRMTQVISWLMLQKALIAGDITQEEAQKDEYRVLRGKTCLEREGEKDSDLPPRLRELLIESRNFYMRILRLDKMARKQFLTSHGKSAVKSIK